MKVQIYTARNALRIFQNKEMKMFEGLVSFL